MTIKDGNLERARRLEHRFVWFIVTLIVLVNLFVLVPASVADECINAHRDACEDLIGAEVFFEKVGEQRLEFVCGFDAKACAVLDLSNKTCTIYYKTRAIEKAVYEHEMNHCRGWFHKSRDNRTYHRPWVDYMTFLGE